MLRKCAIRNVLHPIANQRKDETPAMKIAYVATIPHFFHSSMLCSATGKLSCCSQQYAPLSQYQNAWHNPSLHYIQPCIAKYFYKLREYFNYPIKNHNLLSWMFKFSGTYQPTDPFILLTTFSILSPGEDPL